MKYVDRMFLCTCVGGRKKVQVDDARHEMTQSNCERFIGTFNGCDK